MLKSHPAPRIVALPDGLSATSPHALIATWFGSGRLRPGPGTWGSLAAIPFAYLINFFGGPLALFVAALLLFIVGVRAATVYGRHSGVKDDQSIVVDEVIGLWIAALPAGTDPVLWLVAFLLFRFFDIYKPWPASYFDRRKKYDYDVLMDDVIAGIFAMGGVAFLALQRYI
jgi:phosphatidylglycerophosphatase A